MKKIRVFLAVSALLIAFGGALAANSFAVYYQPQLNQENEWECMPESVEHTCSPGAGEPCKVGFELRQSNTPLANPRCGQIVVRD